MPAVQNGNALSRGKAQVTSGWTSSAAEMADKQEAGDQPWRGGPHLQGVRNQLFFEADLLASRVALQHHLERGGRGEER